MEDCRMYCLYPNCTSTAIFDNPQRCIDHWRKRTDGLKKNGMKRNKPVPVVERIGRLETSVNGNLIKRFIDSDCNIVTYVMCVKCQNKRSVTIDTRLCINCEKNSV